MRRFLSLFGQHRLLGGAFALALTQAGASIAGLLRDRLLNQTFPGLDTVDVYIASFRPSDLLFQIAIMSGISTILLPMLARHTAKKENAEASALLSSVMLIGSALFGVLALILAIIFPLIASSLVGFQGASLHLYIVFGRLALLTNFLFVFGNALGQYLNVQKRYWIYGVTPILYTAGTIFGTIFLTPFYGELGPMLGTLLGAIFYVVFRFAGAMFIGYKPVLRLWHPDLSRIGWLMVPRMLALAALQLQLLVFDSIASHMSAGSVTINSNTRNFESFVVGVIGIALAQSAFAHLSESAAQKEWSRFWMYMKKGVFWCVVLTIPASAILVLCDPIAETLVHLRAEHAVFVFALIFYAIAIPFESLNHLYLRAYYSLHVTGTPAIFSVLNGVIAILVAWFVSPMIGIAAIPIGFLAGQGISFVGLAVLLPKSVRTQMERT
jgi:putative peptidoglycan lipid II flippase